MASSDPRIETIAAELSSIADSLGNHRARVAALAEGLSSDGGTTGGSDREDLVTAIYEAERSLIGAERLVRRAVRTAR